MRNILRELERALLTDAELAAGVDAWREFDDVFFDGEYLEARERKERQERQEDKDQESADCNKSFTECFEDEKVALRARRVASHCIAHRRKRSGAKAEARTL